MISDIPAIVARHQGVVAAVGNQIAITEKLLANSLDVVLVPQPLGETIKYIAISPDGHLALSGGGHCLSLWDVATGFCVWSLGVSGTITSVAYSPDGKHVMSGQNSAVHLWDVFTGKCIRTFNGHFGEVDSVAFSPDGRLAMTSSKNCTNNQPLLWSTDLFIWDVQSGICLNTLKGNIGVNSSVCFSSDGRFALSGGEDSKVRLWDIETASCLRIFEGHTDWVDSVCFSPDDNLGFSISYFDHTLRIWDIRSGVCKQVINATPPYDSFYLVTCSPDGLHVLLSSHDQLQLWNIETCKQVRTFVGHNELIDSVSFCSNGRFALSASQDASMRMWDIATGECRRIFKGHSISSSAVAFSCGRKRALIAGSDNNLRLIDLASGVCLSIFIGHNGRIEFVALAANAHVAISLGDDRKLRFWHTVTGECFRIVEDFPGKTNIAISSDGAFAIWGAGNNIILMDIDSGDILHEFVGHTNEVTSVAFYVDVDYIVSVSNDNTIKIWDIESELECNVANNDSVITIFSEFLKCSSIVTSTVIVDRNSDLYLITTDSLGNCYIWYENTQLCLAKYEIHKAKITTLAFSCDGNLLLTGSDDSSISLWDLANNKCLHIFTEHSGPVSAVGFLSNDRVAISASHDGIQYWDVGSGVQLARSYIFDGNSWAAIASDGRYDSSDNGECRHLRWTAGLTSYQVTRFKSRYYNPEILGSILGIETLEDIRVDIGDCHQCSHAANRTNLVFGAGSPKARLIFIGEAPDETDGMKGTPFSGIAGQLLKKIIMAMGFHPDEVYICNILKCQPKKNFVSFMDSVKCNRQPSAKHSPLHYKDVRSCYPYLCRQIASINPDAIVALGTLAAQTLLNSKKPICELMGNFHDFEGIPVMPTYAPAYLLRNPELKQEVWNDMQKVMKRLGKNSR